MESQFDVSIVRKALESLGIEMKIDEIDDNTNDIHHPIRNDGSHITQSASFQSDNKVYLVQISLLEERAMPLLQQSKAFQDMELDLQTILETCREVIFVSDKSGRALRVSDSWKDLFFAEGEDFIEKGVLKVEEEGIINPSSTRLVMEQGEQVQIVQETKNGRTLMVTGIPIKDEDEAIKRIVSISEDITEVHSLKKKLSDEKVKNKRLNELLYDKTMPSFVFNSEVMNTVMWTVFKIAPVDSTVLITGESGVGKEVIAEYIHKWSERVEQPFVKINCGSIPENLLESELFGYVRGAFTGASGEGKQGLFEAADGGTIFLDEIGEMPAALQVKLLRVLQEQEVIRIGSTSPISIDVRVIAATNRNLEAEIKEGNFRKDLFYRLNVVPIFIPPLRDRLEDLLQLVLHFTDVFNRKFNSSKVFSPESNNRFYHYGWPGNIRELQNIVERTMVMAETNYIEPKHLPDFLQTVTTEKGEEFPPLSKSEPSVSAGMATPSIYNQLARHYRELGITHGEWGLISVLFTCESDGWTFYVTEGELSQYLRCGTRQVRKLITSLKKKGYLQVTQQWKKKGYDLKPLISSVEEFLN
ncbi:sigma-54 interaction domain-containing protein [Alteribacillus iranensis]|uniref:Transcriptional regulator containing PAS, AAA-type ATPase, and DNA-binding Fis domains n=1 Tax=Alteribacillus iranensis TaxID=930128 RepID=A0A1I2BB03_9BACI|nr:sigma 54-interacting transcriptional regulator [Alteribacillus iranensis]SFE53325.1 Transcriptional regulator containing PAS, AAA-type ATPase, and DNA-binding Fis domains [Alteribacillus iranensis]